MLLANDAAKPLVSERDSGSDDAKSEDRTEERFDVRNEVIGHDLETFGDGTERGGCINGAVVRALSSSNASQSDEHDQTEGFGREVAAGAVEVLEVFHGVLW